jgi:5-methyltetrahydropteroyltriglutamate--homocysteine methyltransferase
VVRKLKQIRRLAAHESEFLRRHADGLAYKVTLPDIVAFSSFAFKPEVSEPAYSSWLGVAEDIAEAMRREVAALIAEGVPYIQIDAPTFALYCDPGMREKLPKEGLECFIALNNRVFEATSGYDAVAAVHLCRGNSKGRWLARGGYDFVAEELFSELKAGRYLLEYDSDRAGGFEPLRFMPKGKTVVLGLVTTKDAAMESDTDLLRRIEEAAKYVPIEQLALSPQCGFSSRSDGAPLTEAQQWRKLELVAKVAEKVWP